MPLPDKRLVVTLFSYNKEAPSEGLRTEKLNLQPLQPGQCLVAMLHAPIHPSDINIMQGVYCHQPEQLPSVIGNEGCGHIISTNDVAGLAVGDLVISWQWDWGAFAQYIIIPATKLIKVPAGIPPRVACFLAINPPTAWGLLHDTVPVTRGDWIIQNAANSAVGLAVVEVARDLGVRVINLVRRAEAADIVRAAGGEHVFVDDDPTTPAAIASATAGARIGLGLNAVGGASARLLSRCLSTGGTLLTYGAMSQDPIPVGGGQLIFKDLRFLGFHLGRWRDRQTDADLCAMWERLFAMAASGAFAAPIEHEYPLTECVAAVQHAARPKRSGKVLFTM